MVCRKGEGFARRNGVTEEYVATFPKDCLGLIREENEHTYTLWLIASDTEWIVSKKDIEPIDTAQTGDDFNYKICNVCFCLKPTDQFEINRYKKTGFTRRPSCADCRTKVDMRNPKSRQKRNQTKNKPKKGDPYWCPCRRHWVIVGLTIIVSDHHHGTGNIRTYICDSCNSALGKFGDDPVCLQTP